MKPDDDVVDARILSTYTLPISLGQNVDMAGPFPLTPAEWAQMIRVLQSMEPGLVNKKGHSA